MDNIIIHIDEKEKEELESQPPEPKKIKESTTHADSIEEPSTSATLETSATMENTSATAMATNNVTVARVDLEAYIDLRVKLKTCPLAFGIEPDKYLVRDLKQAAVYMGEYIIPKIKYAVDVNREAFEAIYLIGEKFEHVELKTCTLFNQGRNCSEGPFHKDTNNCVRAHFCTICWEALWVLASHKVVTCPLTSKTFWNKLMIPID